MDLKRVTSGLKQVGGELFMILCGGILALFPDTAVWIVTRLVGWVLIAAGITRLMKNLKDSGAYWGDWLWTALYFLVGGYLLVNPMSIANLLGRLLGTLLIINGIHDLKIRRYGSGRVLSVITVVAGVVLVLVPRTLINTVLGVAGIALVIIGIVNLVDKLRHQRYLGNGGRRPEIIDAAE